MQDECYKPCANGEEPTETTPTGKCAGTITNGIDDGTGSSQVPCGCPTPRLIGMTVDVTMSYFNEGLSDSFTPSLSVR